MRAILRFPRIGLIFVRASSRLRAADTLRHRACAVLILPLLLLAMPAALEAQDFNYSISNGKITITGYNCSGDSVTLPGTINGLPVTSIDAYAFARCASLTSVTIPNSVTNIGYGAFSGCTGLSGIAIPDDVSSIPDETFLGCTGLTDVLIPNSVTHIGYKAFAGCAGLTNVTIGRGVTLIDGWLIPSGWYWAFADCSRLRAYTIDKLNTAYSSFDGALFNKTQTVLLAYPQGRVGDFTLPDSVTKIDPGAFFDCKDLTRVTIGRGLIANGMADIASYAFRGCTGLTNITVNGLNPSYSSLDGVLFDRSQSTLILYPRGRLGAYTVPDTVNEIHSDAFYNCTGLTSVKIGSGRIFFDDEGCISLTNITVDPLNPAFSSRDGVVFNKSGDTLLRYPTGKAGDYIVPDSVTSIGIGAFNSCARLTSVTIPNSVTNIGSYAFNDCTSLTPSSCPLNVVCQSRCTTNKISAASLG